MYYTEAEIVGSYVRSGCKAKQIKILAELNAAKTSEIKAILKKNGVFKTGKKETRGRKKAAKNAPEEEKKHLTALIPPFDSPVDYWRWKTARITDKAVPTVERIEPEKAAGADDMPTKEKPKQAAGAEYEYTAEEFRKGFYSWLTMLRIT